MPDSPELLQSLLMKSSLIGQRIAPKRNEINQGPIKGLRCQPISDPIGSGHGHYSPNHQHKQQPMDEDI